MTETVDTLQNGATPPTPNMSAAPAPEVFLVGPGTYGLPQSNEAKVSALQAQLEFYFSAQNLAQDKFLKDKMNADRYVPVDLVASFPKVKRLTSSRELLIAVMRGCKNLTLDETEQMVRPARKTERNTLILRDIPSNTPPEQVQALFSGNTPVSVRADIGDTWFVFFENEEQCMEAAKALEEQRFNGNSIHFRVKAEMVLRADTPSLPDAATNGSNSPQIKATETTARPASAATDAAQAAAAQAAAAQAAAAAAAFYPMSYPVFPGGGFVQPAFAQYVPPQFMHQGMGMFPGYAKQGRRGGSQGGPMLQQQPPVPPTQKEGAEAEGAPEGATAPATIHVSSSTSPSSPVLAPTTSNANVSTKQKKTSANQSTAQTQQTQQAPREGFGRYAPGGRMMQNFQPQSFTFNQHANKNAIQSPYPVQYPTASQFGYQYPVFPQFPQQYGAYFPQAPAAVQTSATPSSPSAATTSATSPSQTAGASLSAASLPPQPGTPLQLPAQQLQYQIQQIQLHQYQLQLQQLQHQQMQQMQQQQQQQGAAASAGSKTPPLNGVPGMTQADLLRHSRLHPSALSLLTQPPMLVQYPQGPAQPLFYVQPMMAQPMMQQLDRTKFADRRSPQIQPELGPEHFPALPKSNNTKQTKPAKEGETESETTEKKSASPKGPVVSFWSQKPPESAALTPNPAAQSADGVANGSAEPNGELQVTPAPTSPVLTSPPETSSVVEAPVAAAATPATIPAPATIPTSPDLAATAKVISELAVSIPPTNSPATQANSSSPPAASQEDAAGSPSALASPTDSEDGDQKQKKNGLTWAERAERAERVRKA